MKKKKKKKNNNHKITKTKTAKKSAQNNQKKSFKEWRTKHRKGLMITYCSIVTIIIAISIGIILDNLVTRIDTIESEEPIHYGTEYEDDSNLELGSEEIEQAGEDGIKKIYTKEEKKLITGHVLHSYVSNEETIKEPVKEIIRRGTRKWQYMICSDGSARYFTDEQFQDPKVGFTHSSEDYCVKNNQGTMVYLSDTLPALNPYSNSSYSSGSQLMESCVRTLESIENGKRELKNKTESICRKSAEEAKNNLAEQFKAMGANESQYADKLQLEYNSTYYNCMEYFEY